LYRIVGIIPFSYVMMYQFERLFIVDCSKFVRAFGDIATTHREALRKTIAWYRHYLQAETELSTVNGDVLKSTPTTSS
jgi:hypothetical protein